MLPTVKNREETLERIRLQSSVDPGSESTAVRTGIGDEISLSEAARQLSRQRKPVVLDEIVWGAEAIAPHLGRSTKGAFGALESGKVPGAKKIAGRWALNLRVFQASFEVSK